MKVCIIAEINSNNKSEVKSQLKDILGEYEFFIKENEEFNYFSYEVEAIIEIANTVAEALQLNPKEVYHFIVERNITGEVSFLCNGDVPKEWKEIIEQKQ